MILKQLLEIVSKTFDIKKQDICLELGYQDIAQWDSLNHINLMLALEREFKIIIDAETVLSLNSIANIQNYIIKYTPNSINKEIMLDSQINTNKVYRGLNGVYYDYSSICLIDGHNGKLYYRDYPIETLLENYSFEEVIGLILFERIPNHDELNRIKNKLFETTRLPNDINKIIKEFITLSPFTIIQMIIPYYCEVTKLGNCDSNNIDEYAFKLLNLIPLIIGQHNIYRNCSNKILEINPNWSYAKNVLSFLTLKEPDDSHAEIFEKDLIMHTEHESNASTFVARISASAHTTPLNSLIAAMATFSGDLHGGALTKVAQMIDDIGDPKNVEWYIQNRLENKLTIYGYGHRVYRTLDPRAKYMEAILQKLVSDSIGLKYYSILRSINKYMEPYISHGMYPNVDFYDAVIYKLLNITNDLMLPSFIISRLVGWCAHLNEQYNNNILIRPNLKYISKKKSID